MSVGVRVRDAVNTLMSAAVRYFRYVMYVLFGVM